MLELRSEQKGYGVAVAGTVLQAPSPATLLFPDASKSVVSTQLAGAQFTSFPTPPSQEMPISQDKGMQAQRIHKSHILFKSQLRP